MAAKLSDQAIATRDLAKRARRLAGTFTIPDDAARLLRYADDLEAQAVDLDKLAKEGRLAPRRMRHRPHDAGPIRAGITRPTTTTL